MFAVLYQAAPPPPIGGVPKPFKPGGYSDSGADIAFALREEVVTPVADPNPARAFDWVFPDTADGIQQAIAAGADVLWANTVLYAEHPLASLSVKIVGQSPAVAEAIDNKHATNARLRAAGLPVVDSFVTDSPLLPDGLAFPLVLKPIRGRGSQGVVLVDSPAAFARELVALQQTGLYGREVLVDCYLPGQEITVALLPPDGRTRERHWALPPVHRFDHRHGIVPYSADVPVIRNSMALKGPLSPELQTVLAHCERAAQLLDARAVLRIDCRADDTGQFFLFDINAKPNLTGPGRPGRENQQSLVGLAAEAIGWSYPELLRYLLAQAWAMR